jgi:glycosyltransferase involved in cell wall biosynthesis
VGYKAHHHANLDGLVCVNIKQVDTLAAFKRPHRVIYNWAPDRSHCAVANAGKEGALRTSLGIAASAPVVVSVGRLHPSKGMHSLIQAFQSYAPAQAHLVLIGEGPQRQELETLAAGDPRIHLVGFRWDVDAWLADANLYVSASLEEQFPLSMLEAMRAHLPIVATATQGACEMLTPAQSAIVPIGNIPAMGQAIANALMPGAQGVRHHIEYDMSRFDRSTAVSATVDFYLEVLRAQRHPQTSQPGRTLEDARA